MRKNILTICLIIIYLFIFCSCTSSLTTEEEYDLLVSNELPIDTIYATFVYENDKLINVIGFSDYVFLGKVKEYKETITDTPSKIPETVYVVKVIENIKGNLTTDNNIEVIKSGGLSEDYKTKVIFEDDLLPEINCNYIFLVCASEDGKTSATGANTTMKIENTDNYTKDSEYLKCIEAYENQVIYDRVRYKSIYEQE